MKEIIAIIRPKKMGKTKDALDQLGFPGITAMSVIGRGKQRGIASEVSCDIPQELIAQSNTRGMEYIPKRMFSIVVRDEDVEKVTQAIVEINQTTQIGDGRIFVCPVDDAVRVRTDETGEEAIL